MGKREKQSREPRRVGSWQESVDERRQWQLSRWDVDLGSERESSSWSKESNAMRPMMRVINFGLFICPMIRVASPLQPFDTTEETQASQWRYHSHEGDYPQRSYNNGLGANHFEHPPNYPHHDGYNRRTFFRDFPYGTTTPFPTFYQFMTSLFRGRDEYHYDRDGATPPYPFENPYNFRPTEPNYIPPPKPIRASVIKLESITRSPVYSSFEPETTTKYFHNVGTLLNHVLIENSKSPQHFHPEEPGREVQIPPFKPLPARKHPSPMVTTIRPSFHHYNKTDYKYPESVQDQLPHLQFGEPKIPYVSEKPVPQIFDTLPTETTPKEQSGYTRSSDWGAATDILGLIDVRGLGLERGDKGVKSFPGAVEKVKRPVIAFRKKTSTHLDKTSVERVTNLTVEGLSKLGKENVSPSKHVNYQNVKDAIEHHRLESDGSPVVNLNDELSLDAKILKDTNWDGLTTSEETFTTVGRPKTTQKNKPAFWEIADNATLPFTETTRPATTVTTGTSETTTELWYATRDSNETNEPTTTAEETSSPKAAQPRSLPAGAAEEKEEKDGIILTERTPKRRYSRRPKIVNFTASPRAKDLEKRFANRTHFPRRQKPNITLSFGNKNILKNGKDEVMKFSDEEMKKRRKIGKRRQIDDRVRASTSERSVREDSL